MQNIVTYEWLETRIYNEDLDSIFSYKPSNEAETFHMVRFQGLKREEASWIKIYRGDKLLIECPVVEDFTYNPNDSYCLGGKDCIKLGCDYDLCYEFYMNDIYVFYQFPFLEGEFGGACNSASLFRYYYGPF